MTRASHETFRQRLIRRRHTALLIAIVTAFAVRPLIGDSGLGPVLFSCALLAMLLMGLITVQVDELEGERDVLLARKRRRMRTALVLAVPAVLERIYILISPSPRQYLVGSIIWFLFFAFITWNQLRVLLKHKSVTTETISMSISIYLLLGFTWGVLYVVLFQFNPHSFDLGAHAITSGNEDRLFQILIYFSLTTISTVGFGDIAPLSLQARYVAVAEGITGQFYLAILVARLVGMHMSASVAEDDGNRPATSTKGKRRDSTG